MADVEFENEQSYKQINRFQANATPTLVRIVMKIGIAKTEQQANYVLIGVMVFAFLLSFIIVKNTLFGGGSQNVALPPGAVIPGSSADTPSAQGNF